MLRFSRITQLTIQRNLKNVSRFCSRSSAGLSGNLVEHSSGGDINEEGGHGEQESCEAGQSYSNIGALQVEPVTKTNSRSINKHSPRGSPIMPPLSPEEILSYSRVLSISISGNQVSWNLVRKLPGEAMLYIDLLGVKTCDLLPKSHFLNVLNQITELGQKLPPCDLCICEEYPAQLPSTYMFNFYLQMAQARSMLLGFLAARTNPPKIVSIKTVAIAKLFNTYIGSEKVSGQHLVENMFETATYLKFDPSLFHYYITTSSVNKEHLSNVFLTNLAYWRFTNQLP